MPTVNPDPHNSIGSMSQSFEDDEDAFVLHQSYILAQEEALTRTRQRQEEERLVQEALRASQSLADAQLARELQQREEQQVHEQQWKYYDNQIVQDNQEEQQTTWDCRTCTHRNPPFVSPCQACGTPPPPHVLSFQSVPSDLKFGVELEILIPQGVRDGLTLSSLAKSLTVASGLTVKFCGYTHETMECWKIVTDASVQGNAQDLSLELVSPVLKGQEGLKNLRSMLAAARQVGIATNSTCGLHVHIDATNTSLEELQRTAQCFTALEDAFDLLVARSWNQIRHDRRANRNRYCQSNRIVFGQKSNLQRWKAMEDSRTVRQLVQLVNPDNDRYRKLNMTNLVKNNRPSTIEYRNHGSVEEIIEAEAWVRLLLRFTHASQSKRTASGALLPQNNCGAKVQLDRLFDIVACPGLEQYFCVDRRLFDGQGLSNEWQCETCNKIFSDSRSLSQHCSATGHS